VADLAVSIAARVDPGVWGPEAVVAVRCEALASRVEALLHVGELRTAAGEARELVTEADERIGARLRGDVHLIAAHVARRCGEIEEAAALLMAARGFYEAIGDGSRLGRALLRLGEVYREHGQVDLAVSATRGAVGCFEDGGDREAERCARHNLAIFLCDEGRPLEARAELERSRMLRGEDVGPRVRAISRWVEGRIHEEIGDVSRAEGLYRRVRKELLQLGAVAEAVRVGLDLVGLWVETERQAEAERGVWWLEVLWGEEPDLAEVRVELVGLRDAVAEGGTPGELLRRLGRIRKLLPGS
jgi:tetratricopeptide (TPR) repeat protein